MEEILAQISGEIGIETPIQFYDSCAVFKFAAKSLYQ